ncbi:transposase [Nitrolancea hollandica]
MNAWRRSRFTEQQITAALRHAKSGSPVIAVCQKLQIIEQTFHR